MPIYLLFFVLCCNLIGCTAGSTCEQENTGEFNNRRSMITVQDIHLLVQETGLAAADLQCEQLCEALVGTAYSYDSFVINQCELDFDSSYFDSNPLDTALENNDDDTVLGSVKCTGNYSLHDKDSC